MIQISLEQGKNRRTMARTVLKDLPDFIDRIKKANQIFINPNLIHHERALAVTHLDTIRGALDIIREYTQTPVTIGDAGFTGTVAAFRNFGYDLLPEEYEDVTILDLNDDDFIEGQVFREDGSLNVIRRSKTAADSDFRISIAPIKVHRTLGVSLAIENWCFGTWLVPSRIGPLGRVWARWPWLEEQGDVASHKTIAKLYQDLPFDLSIIDGVMAMEGNGPIEGDAVEMKVMLASFSPISADFVACNLMGLDPESIGYLHHLSKENPQLIDLAKMNLPPMLLAESQKKLITPMEFSNRIRNWQE